MHEVLGVLMMRFWAVTGSCCLVGGSLVFVDFCVKSIV